MAMGMNGTPARRAGWVVALLGTLLLGACAASGPDYGSEMVPEPTIDYPARHQLMLDTVLVQPHLWNLRLEAEQRQRQEQDNTAWQVVMARQRAFLHYQAKLHQGDRDQFLHMLERQHTFDAQREPNRADAWARFIEKRGEPPAGAAAPGAPPAGQP